MPYDVYQKLKFNVVTEKMEIAMKDTYEDVWNAWKYKYNNQVINKMPYGAVRRRIKKFECLRAEYEV